MFYMVLKTFDNLFFSTFPRFFFQLQETNPEAGIMNEYVKIDFKFYFGIFIAV